jgi:hypothetical protein
MMVQEKSRRKRSIIVVAVYLKTGGELTALRKAAKAADVSLSRFIRQAAMTAAKSSNGGDRAGDR